MRLQLALSATATATVTTAPSLLLPLRCYDGYCSNGHRLLLQRCEKASRRCEDCRKGISLPEHCRLSRALLAQSAVQADCEARTLQSTSDCEHQWPPSTSEQATVRVGATDLGRTMRGKQRENPGCQSERAVLHANTRRTVRCSLPSGRSHFMFCVEKRILQELRT